MAHIFLSYARTDGSDIANELVNRLRALEHQVFFDVHSIRAGAQWRTELHRRIKSADIIIVVVTPGSNDSDYVYEEVNQAAGLRKMIIPIQVNETPLPVHLRGTWQAIKYQNNNIDAVLLEIERALREMPRHRLNPSYVFTAGIAAIILIALLILVNRDDNSLSGDSSQTPTFNRTQSAEMTITSIAAPTLAKMAADRSATLTAIALDSLMDIPIATGEARNDFFLTETSAAHTQAAGMTNTALANPTQAKLEANRNATLTAVSLDAQQDAPITTATARIDFNATETAAAGTPTPDN